MDIRSLTKSQMAQFEGFCNGLMKETIEPPTEVIAYLRDEFNKSRTNLEALKLNYEDMKIRIERLSGVTDKFAEDLNQHILDFLFRDKEEPELEVIDGEKIDEAADSAVEAPGEAVAAYEAASQPAEVESSRR